MECGDIALSGMNILLAEDNPVNRFFVTEVLNSFGCNVTAVTDGRAALDILHNPNTIDIILLDGMMPVVDGFEVARMLTIAFRQEKLRPIPIIGLTALAMKGDRERCLEAGMDDYLAKPVRKGQLRDKLLEWNKNRIRPVEMRPVQIKTENSFDSVVFEEARAATGDKFNLILKLFCEDTHKNLNAIADSLQGVFDKQRIIISAHSISSSSAHLGAKALSN